MNALTLASYIGSSSNFSSLTFEGVGVKPLPQEIDVGMAVTNWAPAWNLGVIVFKSNEAQEAAAVKFAEYFLKPENNAFMGNNNEWFSTIFCNQGSVEYQRN